MSIKFNFWPNNDQALLLRACLLQNNEDALIALKKWQTTLDLDRIDAGSYRLLPLVTWRLHELRQQSNIPPIFWGCLRQSWVSSKQMQKTAVAAIKHLNEKGVPALIFKGLMLDLVAYPKHGLRPMLDVDIAIPRSDSAKAWDALVENGWSPSLSRERAIKPYLMALEFTHPSFGNVDLHFNFFHGSLDEGVTSSLWEKARPVQIQDQCCLGLCDTDLLLHVIAHGLRINELPSIRWIPDAVYILRNKKVDWNRFAELSEQLKIRLTIIHGLHFLRDTFHCNIPLWVMKKLQEGIGVLEKIEYKLIRCHEFNRLKIFTTYICLNPGANPIELLARLPKHLQKVWDQPTLMSTFQVFCLKILRATIELIFNNSAGIRK